MGGNLTLEQLKPFIVAKPKESPNQKDLYAFMENLDSAHQSKIDREKSMYKMKSDKTILNLFMNKSVGNKIIK